MSVIQPVRSVISASQAQYLQRGGRKVTDLSQNPRPDQRRRHAESISEEHV